MIKLQKQKTRRELEAAKVMSSIVESNMVIGSSKEREREREREGERDPRGKNKGAAVSRMGRYPLTTLF